MIIMEGKCVYMFVVVFAFGVFPQEGRFFNGIPGRVQVN